LKFEDAQIMPMEATLISKLEKNLVSDSIMCPLPHVNGCPLKTKKKNKKRKQTNEKNRTITTHRTF